MPLWLLLHSRNADFWKPCYASRQQLGKTIGIGTSKVTRQLKVLRDVGLLFEFDRGIEPKTRQHRPPARWALDPFTAEMWRPKVEEALARVAEEDGQGGRWLTRALTSLDAFDRRSRVLPDPNGYKRDEERAIELLRAAGRPGSAVSSEVRRAQTLLQTNRRAVSALTAALLDRVELTGNEAEKIIATALGIRRAG